MATAAERQRRYRLHRRGDHSQCDPDRRCKAGDLPAETSSTQRDESQVHRWGPRGQQLWDDMTDAALGPAHRVLLQEACRIADRLDRLDVMLDDRSAWLSVITTDSGDVRLVIDGLLAETRQQAMALKGLVGELRQALPAARKSPRETPVSAKGGGRVASLAAAAARRRTTPG